MPHRSGWRNPPEAFLPLRRPAPPPPVRARSPPRPPTPPPPVVTSPDAVADPNLVTVEGDAAQLAAACLVQSTVTALAEEIQLWRKELRIEHNHLDFKLYIIGAAGIGVRRWSADLNHSTPNKLVKEALHTVAMPSRLLPIEVLVTGLSPRLLPGLRRRIGEHVHRRFQNFPLQGAPLPVSGQVLVPRFEQLRSLPTRTDHFHPPATAIWKLPYVHHHLVLEPCPENVASSDISGHLFLIPPSGPLVDFVNSPDEYVELFTPHAHVDLCHQLVRIWSASDPLCPLYRRPYHAVAAGAAFNCMLLHECELEEAEHRRHVGDADGARVCELSQFHTFAVRLFDGPSHAFGGALRNHYIPFRRWLLDTFGPRGRERFTRDIKGMFHDAFERIYLLANPEDGPV